MVLKQLSMIFIIFLAINTQGQIVYIPDVDFKEALLNHNPEIDTNGDGEIQIVEAHALTGILDVWSKDINDLTGIDAFINITELDCSRNDLSNLFLRYNTALINLNCEFNDLVYLDISYNLALEMLNCNYNKLTELNVSNNINLKEIRCRNNLLTTDWFGNCPLLNYLDASYNQIYNINVSFNLELSEFYCFSNQLTDIDISNNQNLIVFDCTENMLSNIDVSNNTSLIDLNFSENFLTNIDISNNSSLICLGCSDNQLDNIDISNNTNLSCIWCHINNLTCLDISNNPNIGALWCSNNPELKYINLKNTNSANVCGNCQFDNLPNLDTVCVDDINYTPLINHILAEVGHNVTFTEYCTSPDYILSQNNFFNIYPIPTNNTLYISTDKEKIIEVKIFNHLGQLILNKQNEMFNREVDLSELSSGIYIIEVVDRSYYKYRKKIIKK